MSGPGVGSEWVAMCGSTLIEARGDGIEGLLRGNGIGITFKI